MHAVAGVPDRLVEPWRIGQQLLQAAVGMCEHRQGRLQEVPTSCMLLALPPTNVSSMEDGGDVRQLVGGCADALRRLHAATKPAPADSVIGLGVHQINRRFAAACAAAGLEGRRTLHSGRVGLAVELAARGASTRDVQFAGGWKDAGTVARYTARVSSGDDPVSRFMRRPVGGKLDN